MPGTHGTPEFIADLAADIYQMHTPNYREGIRMEMDKFTCCGNTRLNWLKKGAKMLEPLLELLKMKLLKVGSFLNIDETWCRIRIKIKGDGTKLGHYFKKYIWILINKIEQVAYFLYDNDGRYTIDNLPAERAIRPFTVSRKNSLHYSSEEGVEMAMIYLTIIETAKMWGLQVKEYLSYVWREVMSGRSALPLVPEVSRILTTSQ